jgi:hypothetical protein
MRRKPGRPPNPVRTDALDRDLVKKRMLRERERATRPPKPAPPPLPPVVYDKPETPFDAAIRKKAAKMLEGEGYELNPIFVKKVKPGPTGAPVRDDDYQPKPSADNPQRNSWYEDRQREAEWAAKERASLEARFPNRPPPGLPMNQWSAAQLADHKAYLQATAQPYRYGGQGSRSIQPGTGFDPFNCMYWDQE